MNFRLILLSGLILVLTTNLLAKDRNGFGIGPVVGEPTGLNAQFYWDKNSAVDVTTAWSWDNWLLVSVDFQMYDYFMDMPREWKWSYGGGVYMNLANDDHEDNALGIRVPLGLKYHFPYSIVDVWGEVAPGIELAPDTKFAFQGGIGLTFWLW